MSFDTPAADRVLPWAERAGFIAAAAAVVAIEIAKRPEYLAAPASVLAYTTQPETTWVGLVVLALPIVWWLGRHRPPRSADSQTESAVRRSSRAWAMCLSMFVFIVHISFAAHVGRFFHGMPPAYHDEYSYLFQAKTFLAGRLFFPRPPANEFFDQMHVLNDNGVFASRYFPGVGLWLAPWVAWGRPYWGQYLAGGLVASLAFWIGRELGASLEQQADPTARIPRRSRANLLGFIAGLWCAASPAMVVFSNLLLSHHPTTLGLMGFTLCYLRAIRTAGIGWPLAGGVSLALAMLCRPLTAFGFALPFGVHLAWLVAHRRLARSGPRVAAAVAPLVVGVGLLGAYNAALTGSPVQTPYGLYTRIYTPNHAFGFYNVSRGKTHLGPKVLDNYNRWAEELTASRAINLLGRRAAASALCSTGRVTLAWLAPVFVVMLPWLPGTWRLLAAAVAGLHAVYFPFGFEGIFELSYVFESAPILCVLCAATAVWLCKSWRSAGRWDRVVWLALLLLLGFVGPMERLSASIPELRFPRTYYASFHLLLAASGVQPPAVVVIDPDPSDRHRDLVTNSPTLDDPVVRARACGRPIAELRAAFPDRQFWRYDVRTLVLTRLEADADQPPRGP
jgi:4-amino-4-deoxy-L-arabinose transferase-like glycosyltransferase